jgi:2-oxoglutarate dehydrogenase E1 component
MPSPKETSARTLGGERRASGFSGANAEYIDQLYEVFRESPDSVSAEWRSFFYGFEHGASDAMGAAGPNVPSERPREDCQDSGIERLIQAYRLLGHLYADLDPLRLLPRERPRELLPSYYGLERERLQQRVSVVSIDADHALPVTDRCSAAAVRSVRPMHQVPGPRPVAAPGSR